MRNSNHPLRQDVKSLQRTVLQVEDNSANALVVELLIERRSDLRLLTAITGMQGIDLAREHQPDLILMDINMPDISGMTALEILKKNRETAGIPVIALSSNAHPRQIKDGLDAGFFRYLTKPYKIVVLMDAIDAALS